MEKKFVILNYVLLNESNEQTLKDVVARLIDFAVRNSTYPYEFKIYTGTGMRGEEGVGLEFEPNRPPTKG